MFSKRLPHRLSSNRLAHILAAKRAENAEIFDLTLSNPTIADFRYDEAEILAALAAAGLNSYHPAPQGEPLARRAVAAYYQQHGREVKPESIFLTASTSEAYSFLFKLLANPGDDILTPQPSYPLLESLAALECLALVHYPLRYQEKAGWQIELETLQNSISTRTRAIVVVNPNNPTGSFLSKQELSGLNELCLAFDLALIVDEVFLDFSHTVDHERQGSAANNSKALTFVLSGLSKVVCLPQMKLGWIQVSGPAGPVNAALERLEYIADTYLSVGAAIQSATPRFLTPQAQSQIREQVQARLQANYAFLLKATAAMPEISLLPMHGGWYAILYRENEQMSDEERACQLLSEASVHIHPGYFYDFKGEGYLVLSLLPQPEIFAEGVNRLLASL